MLATAPKKLIIVAVVAVVLLGGLLIKRGGVSGSPEATIKAFFEAVNDGDFEKAGGYLERGTVEANLIQAGSFLNVVGTRERALESLVGNIKEVEIESKRTKNSGYAELKIRLTFKPGFKEKVEQAMKENENYAWTKEGKQEMMREYDKNWTLNSLIEAFTEGRTCSLIKRNEGWKIQDL